MFNTISEQLNNYNSSLPRIGRQIPTAASGTYFPIASQFSQFVHKPLTASQHESGYRYYQPKSKIGQLNQRIEEQQVRRQSLRNKKISIGREGYLSDSQRSHSSYQSNSRKEIRFTHTPIQENAVYRQLRHSGDEFAPTKPILREERWDIPKRQSQERIPRRSTALPLPPRPATFASDVSDGSQSSRPIQPEYRTEVPAPNYYSHKQSPIRYPSFMKPSSKDAVSYGHTIPAGDEDVFFDAQSNYSKKQEAPFHVSALAPTFAMTPTPNFTERQQPTHFSTPTSDVKSPIAFNNSNLQQLSDTLDRSGHFAKYLGLGIVCLVLMLMIYEIIR